jgi:hypothetical protein
VSCGVWTICLIVQDMWIDRDPWTKFNISELNRNDGFTVVLKKANLNLSSLRVE